MLPDDQESIPLHEEQLVVTKAEVVTDRVRVSTHVEQRAVVLEDVVERGILEVERIPVEREVASAPEPRQEGDTLIVSIIEERAVVVKRLFVIEELRIKRTVSRENVAIPATLRSMRALIEHDPTEQQTGRD